MGSALLPFILGTVVTLLSHSSQATVMNPLGLEVVQNAPSCAIGTVTDYTSEPCRSCVCAPFRILLCRNRLCLQAPGSGSGTSTTSRPEVANRPTFAPAVTNFPIFSPPRIKLSGFGL
ncbi:hypothetical protein Fcan01_01608 [Folsomia candida]|uniref:Uncharacterized protein n=1 Tax=Folsomia candida TaxID=158441 RepID=A0A226F4M7_FOLCA|nr:hypothetical protein Fcan01_01608 [Folsomia candida]